MDEDKNCNNPQCFKHLPEVHTASCGTSGHDKCQDYLHNKTCWTEEEYNLLKRVLDNHSE